MRMTSSSGKPIRWVPRQPPAATMTATGTFELLPILPDPAFEEKGALRLLNAIRQALIEAGIAREEEP